ncbi:MAG: hypothetical protein KC468_39370, partial [Myxococcales bacterium]|nr:hypothetical protein [Myxococcales bacterium]
MELTKRIKSRLSEATDWNTVLDAFESEASSAGDASAQSKAFFELAGVDEGVVLDKARAMQCYQKAFKLDKRNLLALQHAREIYQEMAHLEMVKRLMGLELKVNRDPTRAPELNYAYGRAILNLREIDQARQFLELAASSDATNSEFQDRFQETLYDRGNWQFALQNIFTQLGALTGSQDPLAAEVVNRGEQFSTLFMKAARILQQESPDDQRLLPLLFKALDANPLNEEAGFVAESLLAGGGHLQHIQKLQDRRASLVDEIGQRVALLRSFAIAWQIRPSLNNPDMAAYFYRQALELAYSTGSETLADTKGHPWHVGAFRMLKIQADQQGRADGLVDLAQRGIALIPDDDDRALVALSAGEIAWKVDNNVESARGLFAIAQSLAANHPTLRDFVAQHGALGEAPSRAAEEQARREAEEQAQRAAEEQARREAEAQAQREAEAQAQREAQAQARREEQARREAEAQAQREAQA